MTVIITSTHVHVSLLAPDLSRIDMRRDIAAVLARLPRFGGHMGERRGDGRIWSVGQHCVVGAKALLEETDDPALALAFLLHDAHEAFIGDITTPVSGALAALCGTSKILLLAALHEMKARLDREILRLAGLRISPTVTAAVHRMDMAMLAAEARQILGTDPAAEPTLWPADCVFAPTVRTHGALSPWPAKRTEDEWMALWEAWRISPATIAGTTRGRERAA